MIESTERPIRPSVSLTDCDGNAFAIMGRCRRAWLRAELPVSQWDLIQREMMSGDYDHLLQIAMEYFDVT